MLVGVDVEDGPWTGLDVITGAGLDVVAQAATSRPTTIVTTLRGSEARISYPSDALCGS